MCVISFYIQLLLARLGHGSCWFFSPPPDYSLVSCPHRAAPAEPWGHRHDGAPPRTCVPKKKKQDKTPNRRSPPTSGPKSKPASLPEGGPLL